MKLLVALIVLCYIRFSDSARILGVFAMCAHSHFTLGHSLLESLAKRGHNVTTINPFRQKRPIKNMQDISVEENCDAIRELKDNLYDMGRRSYWGQLEYAHNIGLKYTQATLRNQEVQELLASDDFDVVVLENFVNSAFSIFPHKFNCPLVWLTPGPPSVLSNYLLGNPSPSSYVPNLLSGYGGNMNFWERMNNLFLDIVGHIFVEWRMLPDHNALLQKYVPDAPYLNDLVYKGNFMLTTSHVSINDPVPLQPNIKEIAGYHLDKLKPLPQDLKEFLDGATDGAIIFSMGSNLRSSDFTEDKKQAILKAFGKIKQKVLWKFEADLPEKPSNVKIVSWLPQQDVLAHPNVVCFITHSGLLGTIEAVYYGVPVLGLPVFWDQLKNIEDAVRRGYGQALKYEELTEESFENTLSEILNNPRYLENARIRSSVMQDQPMKQRDEAVFWIEYVIRHKGATFLRSPSLDMTWYERYMIDVFTFVALVIVALISIIKYVINLPTHKSRKAKHPKKKL